MGRLMRAVGLLAALAVFKAGIASAQEVVEATPPAVFNEQFDPMPDTSGGQLLGLRLLSEQTGARPSGPVFLSVDGSSGPVCIRVRTQDGRYRASNPFSFAADGDTWIRVSSLTQQHRAELDSYADGAVAIRSYLTDDPNCSPANALNVPVTTALNGDADRLAVYINSGGLRVKAALYEASGDGDGPKLADAACAPSGEDGRIAFNTRCTFELAGIAAREVRLGLDFDDGFKTDSQRYRVLLPMARSN